jgi:peptidoglycan/xylan/chitin deacetylase (PgdA/CDA1 family)
MRRGFFSLTSTLLPLRFLISKALKERSNSKIVAPFYHLISSEIPLHVKHLYPVISPEQFKADLDLMLKYFSPIDATEIAKVKLGEKKLKQPPLFLSFDDGFREISTVIAPILQAKGIPATFFVSPAFVDNADMLFRGKLSLIAEHIYGMGNEFMAPNFLLSQWGEGIAQPKPFIKRLFGLGFNDIDLIERIAQHFEIDFKSYLLKQKPYLTLDELQVLAQKGFTIGAHSLNHPNFAEISLKEQICEVEDSLNWIQRNIPNQPRLFAFPFSNFGLSREFYNHFLVKNPDTFNMMFGTAGLKPTTSPKLLHRIPMEVKGFGAKEVFKGEFFYYIAKSLVGKHKENLPYD